MKLVDYLRIPYLLEAQSSETPAGKLVVQARLPELPGCVAEAPTVVQVIARLEALRVTEILRRLRAGEEVPVPRPPLESVDPVWTLRTAQLLAEIEPLLDLEETELRRD